MNTLQKLNTKQRNNSVKRWDMILNKTFSKEEINATVNTLKQV